MIPFGFVPVSDIVLPLLYSIVDQKNCDSCSGLPVRFWTSRSTMELYIQVYVCLINHNIKTTDRVVNVIDHGYRIVFLWKFPQEHIFEPKWTSSALSHMTQAVPASTHSPVGGLVPPGSVGAMLGVLDLQVSLGWWFESMCIHMIV